MTRSWTDPRTGKRWRIDAVRGPTGAGNQNAPGRGNAETSPAITFERAGVSYAVPTPDAGRLDVLEDDRLAELLDAAKQGSGPQADLRDAEGEVETEGGTRVRGAGERSPGASGRESQPHRDPASK